MAQSKVRGFTHFHSMVDLSIVFCMLITIFHGKIHYKSPFSIVWPVCLPGRITTIGWSSTGQTISTVGLKISTVGSGPVERLCSSVGRFDEFSDVRWHKLMTKWCKNGTTLPYLWLIPSLKFMIFECDGSKYGHLLPSNIPPALRKWMVFRYFHWIWPRVRRQLHLMNSLRTPGLLQTVLGWSLCYPCWLVMPTPDETSHHGLWIVGVPSK